MDLCKYSNIFGRPGEGAHKYRIGGVAAIDLFLTMIGAYLTTIASGVPLTLTIFAWLLSSIALHYVFCVQTSVMTYLGIEFK